MIHTQHKEKVTMTTTNDFIAQAMEALILGETDKALGLLMRATISYDADIDRQIVADAKAVKADFGRGDGRDGPLPPMTPINTGKRPVSNSVKCPLCNAKPGNPCVKVSTRGMPGVGVGEPLAGGSYHKKRLDLAHKEAGK